TMAAMWFGEHRLDIRPVGLRPGRAGQSVGRQRSVFPFSPQAASPFPAHPRFLARFSASLIVSPSRRSTNEKPVDCAAWTKWAKDFDGVFMEVRVMLRIYDGR